MPTRRQFLRQLTATGALASTALPTSCATSGKTAKPVVKHSRKTG